MTTQPKHEQIAAHYRRSIRTEKLRPGEPFPTVQQVMAEQKCSVNTASKAFKALQREGLIVSKHGSGTVVAPSANIAVMSGAQSADRRRACHINQGPGESLDGHLAYTWACDRADIADLLGIHIGDDVVVRQRQRRDADGRVHWHNTGYSHYRIVGVVPEILDPAPLGGRWPDMYQKRTGKPVIRGRQQYSARLATVAELEGLGINGYGGGIPVMIKRVVWSDPDGPVDVWEDVMAPGLWDQELTQSDLAV